MTARTSHDTDWIGARDIAHRGLHGTTPGRIENTLSAIDAAASKGYAVEIDVQVTVDNLIAVFHDRTAERLAGQKQHISALTLSECQQMPLTGTDDRIPSLPDALDCVAGRVPIYIELKSWSGTPLPLLCAGVRRALEGYRGDVAIMSFDRNIVEWFARVVPALPRGLVIGRGALLNLRHRLRLPLWLWRQNPAFLACDINLLPNGLCRRWRASDKPLLTWTVRDKKQENIGRQHADALIFEAPAIVGNGTQG